MIIHGRTFLRWLPIQKIPISSKYFGRPKGLYRTTHEYLASPAGRRGAQRSYEIHPAETLRFAWPEALKSEVREQFREHQVKEMPARHVFEIENARFWGHYAGSIITSDDRLLGDLSHDVLTADNHKIFTKFKLPPCRRINGTVAVLATAEAATNYWHWTFDLLPRFHLLEKAGFTPANVDFYLVNHTGLPFQLETMSELGIRPEQIIRTNDSCHLEAERLIVSSLKPTPWHVTRDDCEFLRSFIPESEANRTLSRRLFISREFATFRRLRNEAEIFDLLRPYGFEKVSCDRLSVREQRQLFHEAQCIVAPHGAAMCNLVYCQPGTGVIEIFSPNYIDLGMWPNTTYSGLRHTYLFGKGERLRNAGSSETRREDIDVDLNQFRTVLQTEMQRLESVAGRTAERRGEQVAIRQ